MCLHGRITQKTPSLCSVTRTPGLFVIAANITLAQLAPWEKELEGRCGPKSQFKCYVYVESDDSVIRPPRASWRLWHLKLSFIRNEFFEGAAGRNLFQVKRKLITSGT